MTVTLIGEVVNNCDSVTGFNAGNISADDDKVEGSGAIGAKASATYAPFYTTSLGASAPYAAQSGGSQFGYHLIMYFGAKSPLDSDSGQRIIVGNGTDRGEWYVPLTGSNEPKISIFVSRVVDLARAFDLIAAGSWTLGGNPSQLTSITQVGGGLLTTVSIMGSFNNVQVDQITIGLGVRVDAGSSGTPNTFETVRTQDEGISKWGWWSSIVGAIVGKGKLFIGPETGSAVSVFESLDETVIFAPELVATDFYEIATRGASTDVSMTRWSVSAADSSIARWRLTIDPTTLTFVDNSGVWKGSGELTLHSATELTGTALLDCTHLTQNGAALTGCNISQANTSTGAEFILSDNPGLISNCAFTHSAGHAIRCDIPGSYPWNGNTDSGYTGPKVSNLVSESGSNDAMFYNNSGGHITLNVGGNGEGPGGIRNGVGATTEVTSANITFTGLITGGEFRIYDDDGANPQSFGTELDGIEVLPGPSFVFSHPGIENTIVIQLIASGYQELRQRVTLGTGSSTLEVFPKIETNI
jgi:hypothetical protein